MIESRRGAGIGCLSLLAVVILFGILGGKRGRNVEVQEEGDSSPRGVSPIVSPRPAGEDDAWTKVRKSNVGYFGTMTMSVYGRESANYYTLDVELEGWVVKRIYFPRGGRAEFDTCTLNWSFQGSCRDQKGRTWSFHGSSNETPSAEVEEEIAEEEAQSAGPELVPEDFNPDGTW